MEFVDRDIDIRNLQGKDLRDANLKGANLKGAHLEGANLEGVNLKGANLKGAYLEEAYLEEANLEGANLKGANLKGAYLSETNLTKANLENAILENAELDSSNLEGANLKDANLKDAHLVGVGLENAILENANLEWAILENVYLTHANLTNANLTNANLIGSSIVETNLTNANLTGVIFFETEFDDLENAIVTGTNLTNISPPEMQERLAEMQENQRNGYITDINQVQGEGNAFAIHNQTHKQKPLYERIVSHLQTNLLLNNSSFNQIHTRYSDFSSDLKIMINNVNNNTQDKWRNLGRLINHILMTYNDIDKSIVRQIDNSLHGLEYQRQNIDLYKITLYSLFFICTDNFTETNQKMFFINFVNENQEAYNSGLSCVTGIIERIPKIMLEIVGIQCADGCEGIVKEVFNLVHEVGKPEYFNLEKWIIPHCNELSELRSDMNTYQERGVQLIKEKNLPEGADITLYYSNSQLVEQIEYAVSEYDDYCESQEGGKKSKKRPSKYSSKENRKKLKRNSKETRKKLKRNSKKFKRNSKETQKKLKRK